jgi:hypothetical protein
MMTDPTADDVRRSNMATLANAHAIYIEAIRKSFGLDGLESIGEENRIHGLKLGKAAIASGDLRKGDLQSIFEFFKSAYPYFGFELSLGKSTDSEIELNVTYCPWIDAFKEQGANEDICHWVCKIDEGIGQAVDSELRMSIPKCMMRGDSHCVYLWKK